MRATQRTRWRWVGGVLVLLAGAGCSRESRLLRQLDRADQCFAAGQYEQAELEYFNALRLRHTEDPRILQRLGTIFLARGQALKAHAFLNKAKELRPDDVEVRLGLARLYVGDQYWKGAREELEAVLAKQPAHEEALQLLADTAMTDEAIAAVKRRLEELRPQAEGTAGFHVALSKLQLRANDFAGAEASIRQALALNAEFSAAYWSLGNWHLQQTNLAEANQAFQRASRLAPVWSAARLQYAEFKIQAGAVDAGQLLLEAMVEQAPDCLPALNRLAELAFGRTNYVACETLVKNVLRRDAVNFGGMMLAARLELARGATAEAIARLERLKNLYPTVGQVYMQLATAHWRHQNPEAALAVLQEGATWNPDDANTVLLLAELQTRKGDAAAAVTGLTEFLEQRTDHAPARSLLAHAHRIQGNLGQALALYRNLMESAPPNPAIPYWAGQILRQQRNNAEARAMFERALTIAPEFVPALDQLVELDVAENRLEAADERIQTEIARRPKVAELRFLLAKVYAARNEVGRAEGELLRTVELDPDATGAYLLLARIYAGSEQYDKALAKMAERLAHQPDDPLAWLTMALLHEKAHDHPQARDAYERLLKLRPGFSEAQNNLAWLSAEHFGDLDRAYELAQLARQGLPHDPSVADTLGWILFRRGDYAAATVLLNESVRTRPDVTEFQYHLGMACYMMGREEPARAALQQAVRLGKDFSGRTMAQQCLEVLATDPRSGPSNAVTAWQEVLEREPHDPVAALRLATWHELAGAFDRARAICERTLKFNPKAAPLLHHLALLHLRHFQDSAKAFELEKTAYELDPENPHVAHTLGQLAFAARDYPWAMSLQILAASKLNTNAEVLHDLGRSYYSVGRVPEAVRSIQSALRLEADFAHAESARSFLQLVTLYADPVQANTASNRVAAVLAVEPDNVPASMVRGRLEREAGNRPAAQRTFERVLACYPLFSPAHRELAKLCFQNVAQEAKAYAHALKAYEDYADDRELARILAILTGRRGDFRRSAQILQGLADTSPDDAEVLFHLGIANERLGRIEEGRDALVRALDLATNASWAAEAKKTLESLK